MDSETDSSLFESPPQSANRNLQLSKAKIIRGSRGALIAVTSRGLSAGIERLEPMADISSGPLSQTPLWRNWRHGRVARNRLCHSTIGAAKSRKAEAALRMLMNNLDPEVAEKPEELVVYGGTGKAARNWECFHAIVKSLCGLANDETLLVQSGKPVGIFRTHEYAPRVLLCNSNLVGHWNNWDKFHEFDRAGLMIYGQMTAGSWIYIGTQGILQGTYETFAAAAQKHFGGDLKGKLVVTGGIGGMGGAQPLAATMNGAAFLGIDVDPERIKKRLKTGYIDVMVNSLDEALRILKNAVRKGEATSVGLVGNCADLIPELAKRGVVPDLLTDQTSAHDPLGGYVPNGMTLEAALELRKRDPEEYKKHSMQAIAEHVQGMLDLQKLGDRKSTRLNSSHIPLSRMPTSA